VGRSQSAAVPHQYRARRARLPVRARRSGGRRLGPTGRPGAPRYHTSTTRSCSSPMRADPLCGDRMDVDWAAKSRSGTTPVPRAELVSRLLAGLASRLAVVGWGSSAGLARTSAELGLVAVPHQYRAPSSCSSRVTVRRSGGRRPGSRLGPVGRQGPSRYHTSTARAEIVLAGGRWMSAGQRPGSGWTSAGLVGWGRSVGQERSGTTPVPRRPSSLVLGARLPAGGRRQTSAGARRQARFAGLGRSAGSVAVPHQYRARRARAVASVQTP